MKSHLFPIIENSRDTNLPVLRGVEAFLRQQRGAGAAYRELRPAPDLAAFVACGWVRVVRHAAAQPMPVVPDGCADIITCDDGPPVLVGPDLHARWPALTDNTVITGLRLRPGALRAVLDGPAVELVDTSIPLIDVSSVARRLHADLYSADTLHDRLALLEQWVRARLRNAARDLAVIHACHLLATQPYAEVAEVAAALGWSLRKTHREFIAACGYGPKTMQRILRVQHVMRTVHCARQTPRLIDVAASGGFADQAHMTREFHAITGFTPAHYLTQSDPALGRWLDADWSDAQP
jgi:AraC-like DNA-binding protein